MSKRSPWTATVTLDQLPHCPACGYRLSSKAVVFFRGLAICAPCMHGPRERVLAAGLALHQPFMAAHAVRRIGLTFFVPSLEHWTNYDAIAIHNRCSNTPVTYDPIDHVVRRGDDVRCVPDYGVTTQSEVPS